MPPPTQETTTIEQEFLFGTVLGPTHFEKCKVTVRPGYSCPLADPRANPKVIMWWVQGPAAHDCARIALHLIFLTNVRLQVRPVPSEGSGVVHRLRNLLAARWKCKGAKPLCAQSCVVQGSGFATVDFVFDRPDTTSWTTRCIQRQRFRHGFALPGDNVRARSTPQSCESCAIRSGHRN
jgi:hypothetical protein